MINEQKDKLRAAIREAIKRELTELAINEDDLEEISASGAAGAYSTPNAFSGGRAVDKKKAISNYDNSGYGLADKPKREEKKDYDKMETIKEESGYSKKPADKENRVRPVKGIGSEKIPKLKGEGSPPAKGINATSGKGDQPITKQVRDRATAWGMQLVPTSNNNPDKKLETDESKDDHQDAEKAHTPAPFGEGNPEKLPEQSINKTISAALNEINRQLVVIGTQLHTAKQLKEDFDLSPSTLWIRTRKQLSRTEGAMINLARFIKEIKS